MPSRRVFKDRILREARQQSSTGVITLDASIAALPVDTAVVATDSFPFLDSSGVAYRGAASLIRTYVLGISGGTATIPENVRVQGNFVASAASQSIFGSASGAATTGLVVRAAAGNRRAVFLQTGTTDRWILEANTNAESGSDAGSNFALLARDDSGNAIDAPVSINRAAGGTMTLTRPLSHTATTGSLVQGATGILTVGAAASTATALVIRSAAGSADYVDYQRGTASRWRVGASTAAESGADAGSGYFVQAFNDAGSSIDTVLSITRAAGGTIAFAAARPITGGTYNGQTISSTASFTGTVAVTTSLTVPSLLGVTGITTPGTLTISGTGETLATFVDDGAVTLYHNNVARIATTSDGIAVGVGAGGHSSTPVLDIVGGDFSTAVNIPTILVGTVTTDATTKSGYIACRTYNNSGGIFPALGATANSLGNFIGIGGVASTGREATVNVALTAASTVSGTSAAAAVSVNGTAGLVAITGNFRVQSGSSVFNEDGADSDFRFESDTLTHFLYGDAGVSNLVLVSGSLPNFQSMVGGVYIANATTVPTGDPTGGGFLYAEGGALKWRGSSGTITTIALA